MKVTFDTKNAEEVMEVAILLANMKITLGIESKDAVKVTETPLKDTKEENEPEKPKRKRRTKAEIEAETKSSDLSLADLKEVAQTKARIDRKKVKELISNYGEKLTDVNESDYAELLAKLNEL